MNRTDGRSAKPSATAVRSAAPGRTTWLPRGRGIGWFAAAGLVNAVGTGFFYPYQLLFFPAVTGLRLTTVGTCLTVAALVVLPLVFQTGRVVDRIGTRPVLLAAALLRAAAFVGYLEVRDVVSFTVLAMLVALCQRAEQTSMPVLAAKAAPEGQVARWLALTKVTFNAGIGLGGLIAGTVLATVHSRTGFVVVGLVNAASFAITALLYLPLPTARRTPGQPQAPRRARPWHNHLFLRAAVANFVLLTVIVAVEAALPVYLITVLHDPSWLIGLLFAVNTTVIVLLQLPVAARIQDRAPLPVIIVGVALHAALLIALGLAGHLPRGPQLALLIGGMAIYTFGELLATQSLAVVIVALSPQAERGAYQAFNQVLVGVSLALVPALIALFLAHAAQALWWVLTTTTALVVADMLAFSHRSGAALTQTLSDRKAAQ
ncbi:MFS transporter [Kitasatospora sp. NPDC052896]|uniref:MFS transporter n=1 Tax=Kitasatospora sp. NPDC052896 TaxID=3364061 RepID=UPI0037C8B795